jgi:hypothetical protein
MIKYLLYKRIIFLQIFYSRRGASQVRFKKKTRVAVEVLLLLFIKEMLWNLAAWEYLVVVIGMLLIQLIFHATTTIATATETC